MALKTSFYMTILFTSMSLFASTLPPLATKQDSTNIRYLTRDGKYTYYQRRSGDLLLGTNFNVQEVLKSNMGTMYFITGKSENKWLVIRQVQHFQQSLDPRLVGKIYRVEKGQINALELGEGVAIDLHSNGWVSFYEPHTRLITFKNLDNPQIGFNIQTPPKLNPYFFPHAVMLDEQTVFYVDMNEKGESALISFNRTDGKSKVIFKPKGINRRLELCQGFDQNYLGAFPFQQFSGTSEIWSLSKEKGIDKQIYSSSLSDMGNMVCDHSDKTIFFSKGHKSGAAVRHDIFEFNVESGQAKQISQLNYATQVINHDGLLLIPFQGKYLVPLKQEQSSGQETLGTKE